MIWGGTNSDEDPGHIIGVDLNGQRFYATEKYISHTGFITETRADLGSLAGREMILSLTQVGGSPQSWTAFDYIKIELDPTGELDADGDGLPRYYEEDYQLSDTDSSDANAQLKPFLKMILECEWLFIWH